METRRLISAMRILIIGLIASSTVAMTQQQTWSMENASVEETAKSGEVSSLQGRTLSTIFECPVDYDSNRYRRSLGGDTPPEDNGKKYNNYNGNKKSTKGQSEGKTRKRDKEVATKSGKKSSIYDTTKLTIGQVLSTRSYDFSLLIIALRTSGLWDILTDPTVDLTIFAPTDEAFLELGTDTVENFNDIQTLTNILLYHVVGCPITSQIITDTLEANAESMARPVVAVPTLLDDVTVDVWVTNDGARSSIFLKGTGNSPEDLPQVTTSDIQALNGVIHVIDKVILPRLMPPTDPPAFPSTAPFMLQPSSAPTQRLPTLWELIQNQTGFNILIDAVERTRVTSAVDDISDPDLTFFTPPDDAFEALGEFPLEYLIGHQAIMFMVIQYHAVAGLVTSQDFLGLQTSNEPAVIPTLLSGQTIQIVVDISDGSIFVRGNANKDPNNLPQLDPVDIPASNGYLHIVNQVILPYLPVAATVAMRSFTMLVQALIGTGLDELLNGQDENTNPNQLYTLFAPTNEAFNAMGMNETMLETLLATEAESVTNILLTHVVISDPIWNSTQLANAVAAGQIRFSTVAEGVAVTIAIEEDTLFISGPGNSDSRAKIILPDITAVNGIIHVIDGVLSP